MTQFTDLNLNNSDFSATERLNTYIGNPIWREGYTNIINGNLPTDSSGKIDLNSFEDYTSLWLFLSASCEDIASKIYEKTDKFVQNVRDIETCEFHQLNSIAKELNVNNLVSFDYNYPEEIKKLLYIFSLPYSKVVLSGATSLLDSASQALIYNNVTNLSGKLQGFQTDSSLIFNELTNPSGIWMTYDISGIYNLSANYPIITQDSYISFIDNEISGCLYTFITTDGIIDDIKTNIDQGYDDATTSIQTPLDDDSINALKIKYNVPQDFFANQESDKVDFKIKRLNEYSYNEQNLINEILQNRLYDKEKYGDDQVTYRRNRYQKERKVREYISFIENVYIENSTYIEGSNDNEITNIASSFFDVDSYGNLLSGAMISTAIYVLRNLCLKVSYLREYLRRISQKHAIIGTNTIIKTLIYEYLMKEFSKPEYWGYFNFTPLSASSFIDLSNVQQLSSGLFGDIKVVEYWDGTEYYNISAITDTLYTSGLYPRFWENDDLEIAKLVSEHTENQISAFYSEIFPDKSWLEIQTLLNTIYDIGASSATLIPTYDAITYTLPISGSKGTYGKYQLELLPTNNYNIYISGDIEPSGSWTSISGITQWMNSPLIANYSTSSFLTAWIYTPEASAWIYDLNFDTTFQPGQVYISNTNLIYNNLDQVSAWILNTFPSYNWVENFNTIVWKTSPLIENWSDEQLKSEWAKSYLIHGSNAITNCWTSADFMIRDVSGYGWNNMSSVLDYARSMGHTLVSQITQAEWVSSEFVYPFNSGNPYTSGITNIEFDENTQWATSANPFVSGWLLGDPFKSIYSNIAAITADTKFDYTELNTKKYLNSLDFIPLPDSGLYRDVDSAVSGGITAGSLSAMFFKYLNTPTGNFPPANNKNSIHPSIAYQPMLYNLKKIVEQSGALENTYRLFVIPSTNILNYLKMSIDDYGVTINAWRNINIDYSGYQTFYEFSSNYDRNNNENEYIDQDGPWHPNALSAFLTDSTVFKNNLSAYYGHLNLSTLQQNVIKSQLTEFEDDIIALNNKKIYQYGVDKYQNHYTLYKAADEFDISGVLWMRYHNHPISFPLYTNTSSILSATYLNQLYNNNTINSTIRDLEYISNNCYDFGFVDIDSDNILWLYGQDNHVSGAVNISGALYFINLTNSNNIPSIVSNKLKGNYYRQYFNSEKYIGIIENPNNFQIISLKNRGISPSFLQKQSDNTYTAILNFKYYDNINGIVYLPNVYIRNLLYDEFYLGDNHNQWKLSKANDLLSIAFESVSSTLANNILLYSDNGINKYDITENYQKNIYDNNITLIDIPITENTQSINNYTINYYTGYSDLTYVGINAWNGYDTISNFDISSGDTLKIQYFGYANTDAKVQLNSSDILWFFNDVSGRLGIRGDCFYPYFTDISATNWDTNTNPWNYTISGSYIFTTIDEQFIWVNTEVTPNPIYTITYQGFVSSHFFTVEKISGF